MPISCHRLLNFPDTQVTTKRCQSVGRSDGAAFYRSSTKSSTLYLFMNWSVLIHKHKNKDIHVKRHEVIWGIGGTVPLILKLGGRWKWVVTITLRSHYARTKPWSTYLKKLWSTEKLLFPPKLKPWFLRLPVHSAVAILTELLGPQRARVKKRSDVLRINAGFNIEFFFSFSCFKSNFNTLFVIYLFIYVLLTVHLGKPLNNDQLYTHLLYFTIRLL